MENLQNLQNSYIVTAKGSTIAQILDENQLILSRITNNKNLLSELANHTNGFRLGTVTDESKDTIPEIMNENLLSINSADPLYLAIQTKGEIMNYLSNIYIILETISLSNSADTLMGELKERISIINNDLKFMIRYVIDRKINSASLTESFNWERLNNKLVEIRQKIYNELLSFNVLKSEEKIELFIRLKQLSEKDPIEDQRIMEINVRESMEIDNKLSHDNDLCEELVSISKKIENLLGELVEKFQNQLGQDEYNEEKNELLIGFLKKIIEIIRIDLNIIPGAGRSSNASIKITSSEIIKNLLLIDMMIAEMLSFQKHALKSIRTPETEIMNNITTNIIALKELKSRFKEILTQLDMDVFNPPISILNEVESKDLNVEPRLTKKIFRNQEQIIAAGNLDNMIIRSLICS